MPPTPSRRSPKDAKKNDSSAASGVKSQKEYEASFPSKAKAKKSSKTSRTRDY